RRGCRPPPQPRRRSSWHRCPGSSSQGAHRRSSGACQDPDLQPRNERPGCASPLSSLFLEISRPFLVSRDLDKGGNEKRVRDRWCRLLGRSDSSRLMLLTALWREGARGSSLGLLGCAEKCRDGSLHALCRVHRVCDARAHIPILFQELAGLFSTLVDALAF